MNPTSSPPHHNYHFGNFVMEGGWLQLLQKFFSEAFEMIDLERGRQSPSTSPERISRVRCLSNPCLGESHALGLVQT